MKKVLLILISLFFGINLHAQEKFETYENSYVSKIYDIQLSYTDTNNFTLYIDALSLDNLHEKGGFMIDNKRYEGFLSILIEAKQKYQEWMNIAKENNVTELDKPMPFVGRTSAYFLYGDWNFQYVVYPTFTFKVLKIKGEIKYLLIIKTGELQSSSNKFMKVDGLALVFSSGTEIDSFLNIISHQKITSFINKPKEKDLFK